MDSIRLTKTFRFEMAHVLNGYDGPCSNIHGHSYELNVTVKGSPVCDECNPKNGMALDFGSLKRIVNEQVIDHFDHAFVVSSTVPADFVKTAQTYFDKVIVADYQPTSELMLIDIVGRIRKALPENVVLCKVSLRETATSLAEWCIEDN